MREGRISMHLNPIAATVKAPDKICSGAAYLTPVVGAPEPGRIVSAILRFMPGARTNWHSHTLGQTLHILDGAGVIVGRSGQVLRVRAGDTVWIPPGEEHWHGGTDR